MRSQWPLALLLGGCTFQGRAEPIGIGSDATLPGDAPSIDAGDPPGSYCLGDSIVRICLAQMPSTSRTIPNTAINTDASSTDCATNVVGANMDLYCVVAANGITISGGQTLSAKGSRPLVLVSSSTMTVSGAIDVAGHLSGAPQDTGAAGDSSSCAGATAPAGGGGGYGGGFGASGGGPGGFGNNGLGGQPPTPVPFPSTLRGGCEGGTGGGNGGHSGGAVALIAATSITFTGAVVNASGAGGSKGSGGQSSGKGGGGGGSGGMIVIDAPAVTGDGGTKIFANGGSGGGGGDDNQNDGHDGVDAPADPTMAAPGGAAGGSGAGAGGNGSKGNGLLTNAPGLGASGFNANGGGGGGGGAGVIKLFKGASLPGTVSPPAN